MAVWNIPVRTGSSRRTEWVESKGSEYHLVVMGEDSRGESCRDEGAFSGTVNDVLFLAYHSLDENVFI